MELEQNTISWGESCLKSLLLSFKDVPDAQGEIEGRATTQITRKAELSDTVCKISVVVTPEPAPVFVTPDRSPHLLDDNPTITRGATPTYT